MDADSASTSPNPRAKARHRLSGLSAHALMVQGMNAPDIPGGGLTIPGCELIAKLGSGGMGTVYLARQISLDREVAVKVLSEQVADDPLTLERLEREARTMARLRHPHVVMVHDFHRLNDGGAAIVMEHVEGGSLRERMRQHASGLPMDEALRIFRQVCSGLAAAHAAGLVHRDVKPENVLLNHDGTARVSDFGLAVPADSTSMRLTLTGTSVGTVEYMAPEQMRGEELDARSDVFSLGILLYEMLTCRTPRGSFDPLEVLRPEVPEEASYVVLRAMRPQAANRFADAAEVLAALDRPPPKSNRKSLRNVLLTSALILLVPLAAVVGHWFGQSAEDIPTAPASTAQVPAVLEPGPWRDALAGVNIHNDNYGGDWRIDGTSVVSNDAICVLALEPLMPQAYDVRMTFTRLSGADSVALFFWARNSLGSCELDAWRFGLAGIQLIRNETLEGGYGFRFPLENGRRYELTVEVRPEGVNVKVDGVTKKWFTLKPDDWLNIPQPWDWDPKTKQTQLGIGSYQSPTRFESVEWRGIPIKQSP